MGTKGGIGNDQNHTEDCHPGRMDDHGTPPPSKMGRDQLARAVVHHLYETALGGLDRMIEQNLHSHMVNFETGGEAFILSQWYKGWQLLSKRYDDGCYSAGLWSSLGFSLAQY